MLLAYLFALVLFYLIFWNKLEWALPIVILRSKQFTAEMQVWGKKYSKQLTLLYSIGAFVGIVLMLYSVWYLFQGAILIRQETVARIAPILPGTTVGGIQLPLVQGLLALGAVIIVHEFGHGLASVADGIKPKGTAFVLLLGLIPGAGVELDDKKITKSKSATKLRIFCAGTTMNVILAIIILAANFPLLKLGEQYMLMNGLQVIKVEEGSPAEGMLTKGTVIQKINTYVINSIQSLEAAKKLLKPNEKIVIDTDNGVFALKTDSQGRIGFMAVPYYKIKQTPESNVIFWLSDLFGWTFILSIGMGVANMMPLWPFDGGYVVKEVLDRFGAGGRALNLVYVVTCALVLINLFSPLIRQMIGA